MLLPATSALRVLVACVLTWTSAAGAALAAEAKPNHLRDEKSPYLQQHATNPVDWFPWGDEAFAKARSENKPIFLSIGYSTCHWCHEMERECFTNDEVARLLNESFVSIKVDREERPDVDRVYLTFVQASTGGGGWPLSVWLTPDLKPFFGGTYFPRENREGRPGFKSLLARMTTLWAGNRERVVEQADRMLAALQEGPATEQSAAELPIAALRHRAFDQVRTSFDEQDGGFGLAPKFPEPATLEFLFDVHATTADVTQRAEALRLALTTLRHIVSGGIHDQLGGGFHRYAVDSQWRVPHFEKMLYDQAQLASVCLTAWQLTQDETFRSAALCTLDYVQRRLTGPDGEFYSAEDADSATAANLAEKREGGFYLWTASEIESVLGAEHAAMFSFAFGVEARGNVAPSAAEGLSGENVFFRAHTLAECAEKFALSADAVRTVLASATARLRDVREQRPRPLRDDKVITAWNGLMISAFARAAQITGDQRWTESARRAAEFVRLRLRDPGSGRLARSFCGGVRAGRGFAEDHAFLIQGLLDLYETTFEVGWLQWAMQLQQQQDELFWDAAAGGYFGSAADDASVVLRLKEDSDGVEPSANSIAVRNLARLAELLHRDEWRRQAMLTARAFGSQFARAPTAMLQMLAALGWLERPPQRILIHGEPTSLVSAQLIAEVWQRFLPRHVILRIDAQSRDFFSAGDTLIAALPANVESAATAYLCENFACQQPTSDPAVLAAQLNAASH